MKVFICGSRSITDRQWIFSKLDDYRKTIGTDITVLEGEAKGADQISKEWAEKYNYKVLEYPADWKANKYQAGYIRNEQMTKDCDCIVLLWTGKSSGSFHDIMMAKKYHKQLQVFIYSENIEFVEKSLRVINEQNDIFLGTSVTRVFNKYKNLVGNHYFE